MTGEVDVLPDQLYGAGHYVMCGGADNERRAATKALLLGSTALCLAIGLADASVHRAHAQQAQPARIGAPATQFNIRAQDLGGALNAFADRSGVRLLFPSGLVAGKSSPGLAGSYSREQALSHLLAGTGLNYRFTNAGTVTIMGAGATNDGAAAAVEGAIQLDTVDVSGGRVSPADAPYQTPAPTAHISQETIDRFRGSSPADIFRGTPGVMSGEARNGAGGIDVNIRGMQGMGRVAVTIDGAENGLTVYQGYQGVSNRTFVDPDLLAGVDIKKGSDASSRGIAGTVAMRTLGASDVVKPGEKWGVWVKSGFGTNTAAPRPGDVGGYTWPRPYVIDPQPYPVPTASASGLDRPGWLTPTSGSFSTVAAVKEDNYDLLWGYAFRKQGNYFAGKNGQGASVIDTGPQPLCYSSGFCYYPPSPISYAHVYQNGGLSSYRAGEQVLNTQLETESYLAKATVRDDNGQSLQLGYTGYRSKAGDIIASLFSSAQSQAVQQAQENTTQVDTGTVRYRWKPDDNDLVDLKANFWMTNLNLRAPPRISLGTNVKPEDFGLPYNYLPGNDSTMWGGDVSNKSHLSFERFGSLDLDYGVSYINEATKPIPYTNQLNGGIPSRDATRQEVSGFGKVAYKPIDWLTLNGGLRYSYYSSRDRSTISNALQANPQPSREDSGFSPSAGIVLEPTKGTQFYANYSNALRMPTLFESAAAYTLIPNPDIRPERSSNWEAGVNVIKDGLFSPKDKTMLKFGYFNWDVKDYVARIGISGVDPTYGYTWTGLQVANIDRARFEGLEFSSRYENSGFTAELAANYYLNVEYCLTASTCTGSTLSGDYATNQVPPAYSANLTVSQKMLNDDLTVGGRVSYTGPRSVGHGEVQYGAAAIIAPIYWKPYWLFDAFAEYKLNKDITLWATMENLTDQYYIDPLSLIQQPGPGRTVRLGLTGKFGGSEMPSVSLAQFAAYGASRQSWTGFYAGVHAGYDFARFRGEATTMISASASRENPDLNQAALSFGLQAGYNYQIGNRIVAGIESDIVRSQIGASQITYSNEGGTGNNANNLGRFRQYESVMQNEIEWLATVRGRLGYALNDNLLVYGTGGVALMRQAAERSQYIANAAPTATTLSFAERATLTRVGVAYGAGAEYQIGDGWSVKGEFLFARFGQEEIAFPGAKAGVILDTTRTAVSYTTDFTCAGGTLLSTATGLCLMRTTTTTKGSSSTTTGRKLLSKIDIPMIKIGLNYRF